MGLMKSMGFWSAVWYFLENERESTWEYIPIFHPGDKGQMPVPPRASGSSEMPRLGGPGRKEAGRWGRRGQTTCSLGGRGQEMDSVLCATRSHGRARTRESSQLTVCLEGNPVSAAWWAREKAGGPL